MESCNCNKYIFFLVVIFIKFVVCFGDSDRIQYKVTVDQCDGDGLFFCNRDDNECIKKNLVCNGVSECSTGNDEAVSQCGCLETEFQCNATVCIDMIKRCDTIVDCATGIDEKDCDIYNCPQTHSKCDNHYCVSRDKWCDFVDDCGDNSDEATCHRPMCRPTEFRCNNSQCVWYTVLCDGTPDCYDGSDEEDCDSLVQCENGFYVPKISVCDGWVDCLDNHADETDCGPCTDGEFLCNNGRCITEANVCDGICDCATTCEDENKCESLACPVGEAYLCRDTLRCIKQEYLCDGHNDCLNTLSGADEFFCWNISNGCLDFNDSEDEKSFVCPEGRCLPASGRYNVICDHYNDCLNGEDEIGCDYRSCNATQFTCDNHHCIPEYKRCDGTPDCFDRSDEVNCDAPCRYKYRQCGSGQCIHEDQWCDFRRDCPDNSDELNCEKTECVEHEFRCKNGECVNKAVVCYNGTRMHHRGCADESHLVNCRLWECKSGQFKCRNSYCIDETQVCDKVPDCKMILSDEEMCEHPCPHYDGNCTCHNMEINCENQGWTRLPQELHSETSYTKFRFAGNYLNYSLSSAMFESYDRLTFLDLNNNSLGVLPAGCFQNLWRLVSLNLGNNYLYTITNGTFAGLSRVTTLYMSNNRIEEIEPHAFLGLSQLKVLDLSYQQMTTIQKDVFVGLRSVRKLILSYNRITVIYDGAFNGLPNLLELDITNNVIVSIGDNALHGLSSLRYLYTDDYRYCCIERVSGHCFPEHEFSSCEDLMSRFVLRISIWVLGLIAFFGNALVISWRARDFRNGKVHSFLITNLAIGDFFMGAYLLIIAVVDSYYRGRYIMYDTYWRESGLCKFAGFISTFSSELSVFTLTVITLDRLICIIFPLKLRRLGLKEAFYVMIILWCVVFVLSSLPLMGLDYFHNFYGRSGVCLALHITPSKPKGWEYSVFVFLAINFVSFLIILISYMWMFAVAKQTKKAVRQTQAKKDNAMAKRMTLIVLTDFVCWVPIILLGCASLAGAKVPTQVYAWIAVFVLPFNSAINPVLYTISTAPFLRNVRRRVSKIRKSVTFRTETKQSYLDDRSSHIWSRNSAYRELELIRIRNLNKPGHSSPTCHSEM